MIKVLRENQPLQIYIWNKGTLGRQAKEETNVGSLRRHRGRGGTERQQMRIRNEET